MPQTQDSSPLAELISINPELKNPVVNVIFVHGLDGDAIETWNFHIENSWHTWILEKFPSSQLLSIKYRLHFSNLSGGSMPLPDRARNILHLLVTELDLDLPIVFVCHSYGGLLVKQMLRTSRDMAGRYIAISNKTTGVCFLSTPNNGSKVADYVSKIGILMRAAPVIQELSTNEANIRDLNYWFRGHHETKKLDIHVFCEKLKTNGVLVVDEASADPGISWVYPIPFDCNHVDICKPNSADGRVKDVMLMIGKVYKFNKSSNNTITPMGMVMLASDDQIAIRLEILEAQVRADPTNESLVHALIMARKANAKIIEDRIRLRKSDGLREISTLNARTSSFGPVFTIILIAVLIGIAYAIGVLNIAEFIVAKIFK